MPACLFFFRSALLALGCLSVFSAQAGIVLNTTRVIYQGKDKEVSLGVHNSGAGEILLQSWLEPYDPTGVSAQPQDSDLPFMVTPPLAHLQGDGKQLVRIIHAGHGMPSERESVLWLNVQEIPAARRKTPCRLPCASVSSCFSGRPA